MSLVHEIQTAAQSVAHCFLLLLTPTWENADFSVLSFELLGHVEPFRGHVEMPRISSVPQSTTSSHFFRNSAYEGTVAFLVFLCPVVPMNASRATRAALIGRAAAAVR